MIKNGYLIKLKRKIHASCRVNLDFNMKSVNFSCPFEHVDCYVDLDETIFLVTNIIVGKYYYLIYCYDVSDYSIYTLLISLDKDLFDFFEVISDDVKMNTMKSKLFYKDDLCLQPDPDYMAERNDRLHRAENAIKEFTKIPLFYVGDTVSYKGQEYKLTCLSKAETREITKMLYLKKKYGKKNIISTIDEIELLCRTKEPNILFSSRYINDKGIKAYDIEKG